MEKTNNIMHAAHENTKLELNFFQNFNPSLTPLLQEIFVSS